MRLRSLLLFACLLTAFPATTQAQTSQPYILGEVGGSFGDGGTAPAVALGLGYLTPRNIGFEFEVSYVPELDFGDPGIPRIAIFPPIEIEASGRIVGLQTNIIGILPGGDSKLRAFVVAGGGIADVEQRIRIRGPIFTPVFPGVPGLPEVPVVSRVFDRDETVSETSLILSAGAGFEYGLTDHLGLGMSVRYQRLFSDPSPLDIARVAVRTTWKF